MVFLFITLGWIVLAQSCFRFRISDSKAKAQFDSAGVAIAFHTITVDNHQLHYAQTGNDSLPTLLFIHGSPGSWDAFIDYLKDPILLKKFRMVSVDRPGFGYSDFGEALPLAEQSEVIAGLFPLLKNNQPIYLIGHSMGGPVCVELASTHPRDCNGIVILAGSIDYRAEPAEKWRWVFARTPFRIFMPGAFRPSNDEIWYLKKDLVQLYRQFDLVICPVHFVHGSKDQFVAYANMTNNVQGFPNAAFTDTLTIPGANHFIPWQHYFTIRSVLLDVGKKKF